MFVKIDNVRPQAVLILETFSAHFAKAVHLGEVAVLHVSLQAVPPHASLADLASCHSIHCKQTAEPRSL